MTANTYYSAVDNGALPSALPSGITNNNTTSNPNSVRYQQSWIFQGAPTVQDMAIKIGGSPTYSTAVFAQTGGIVMNRVDLELAGRTIIGQLSTASPYNVKFTDVDINITGNENSILTTQVFPNTHVYWASTDARTSTVWGKSLVDNAASTTAVDFGGTKLASSTSKNTIFYIAPAEMHRWNGASNMVPLPGQSTPAYNENSEAYFMFAPVLVI